MSNEIRRARNGILPHSRSASDVWDVLPKKNLTFTVVKNSNTQNASAALRLHNGCMLIVMGMLEQAIHHCHGSGVS